MCDTAHLYVSPIIYVQTAVCPLTEGQLVAGLSRARDQDVVKSQENLRFCNFSVVMPEEPFCKSEVVVYHQKACKVG